ncbi:hypothetical protein FPSE_04021 [Fusarium pseudograminearum CS3096]|uniref:C2H2-type domain-containing protein n=1 Tax=Fusarium pseudograminearum (strain CS3096) TaxID=1028729 RepID=K3UTQ1_FUSPC|nr:hypothetical protein FPSE_04021 [Fusarium pseudograminearum CS3096]EKJ75841.1 hypothetical protein FPSE_04021 [Fusarium pseudograminearum CS3096]
MAFPTPEAYHSSKTDAMGDNFQDQDEPTGQTEEKPMSPSRDAGMTEESKLVIQHEFGHDYNSENQDIYDVILVSGIKVESPVKWKGNNGAAFIRKALDGVGEGHGRQLFYEYHTDVVNGIYYTPDGVYKEAEALLNLLSEHRTPKIKETRRPIYFFSHDIGGTIVKAALSLASKNRSQYADILDCTRAVCFFAYPHRCPNQSLLQDAMLRLMSEEPLRWSGNMLDYAKSLSETILHVNDNFLQTQILTQAKMMNVVYTFDQDPEKQVFPLSMCIMGIPSERVIKIESPYSGLMVPWFDDTHPFNHVADSDWLCGDLTDEQHVALRKIINQASPVFPYEDIDTTWQHPGLLELAEANDNCIIHIRCSHGADRLSENAAFFINNHSTGPLLYMKFDTHDVRFNNCEAMLRLFLARLACNKLQSGGLVGGDSQNITDVNFRDVVSLFGQWEYFLYKLKESTTSIQILGCFDECDDSAIWFLSQVKDLVLRSELRLKIVITTTNGSPGDDRITSALSKFPSETIKTIECIPVETTPFPVDLESSKLMQQYPSVVGPDQRREIRGILTACTSDHKLCELVLQWLSSDREQITRIQKLVGNPLTPGIVFAELLDTMEDSHRPWAKILLSWVLVSYRPLRAEELLQVSNIAWKRTQTSKTMRPALADIMTSFRGLLAIVNGEVRFRHPYTRSWLSSQRTAIGEDMWYCTTEGSCHKVILQTCIDHLNDMSTNAEDWVRSFPYAIEFWFKHSPLFDGSEDLLLSLFEDESVFQRWAKALVEIPSRRLNPLPDHIKPLPMAAHLGLMTVVKALLEGHPDQVMIRDQALIEACRAGHAHLIRIFMDAKMPDISAPDLALQEAAKQASKFGSDEALRELVNSLPMPPDLIPVQQSVAGERRTDDETKEEKETEKPIDTSPVTMREASDETEDDRHEPDPLQWLSLPMYRAAASGMEDIVEKLLQFGVKPNPAKGTTPDGNSYLRAAVGKSHHQCAKLLIDAGEEMTKGSGDINTLLGHAVGWASGEMVQLLLENGARIDEPNSFDEVPLASAVYWGCFAATKAILSYRDYREYYVDEPGKNPVDVAVEHGHYRCLKIVLDHGFSPNIYTSGGDTALRCAAYYGRMDICKLLLQYGADPDLTPEGAVTTPLIQAVTRGDLDMVKLLVEYKVTIDKGETSVWSRTPMHVAVDSKKPAIVQYLLAQGADPNVRDSEGVPPIASAVKAGDPDVVQWLVEKGAAMNLTNASNETTLLHEAISRPETLRVLLQHGADITMTNKWSHTALDVAIGSNYLTSVRIILEQARDKLDLGSESTRRALCEAVTSGYTYVVGALLEAGADVNTVNVNGESLLMLAVKHNRESNMVCMILDYNPNLTMRDDKQNTALHHINKTTRLETVRRIVNSGGKLDAMNDCEGIPFVVAIKAQLDDVFTYMLTKQPTLAIRCPAASSKTLTPLHEACINGTLSMVRTLVHHKVKVDVNASCEGIYGTPLIATTLRSDIASPTSSARHIFAQLLSKGADSSIASGVFRYPLISACLAGDTNTIELCTIKTSPTEHDSLQRKPVHLACYNSLEAVNQLKLLDSEYAARDIVGRVPLHYAVMNRVPNTDMVSFLLDKGADAAVKGKGVDRDWTAHEVAYYYHTDSFLSVLPHSFNDIVSPRKRGDLARSPEKTAVFCDCCLLDIYGFYYTCSTCFECDLCDKCYLSVSKIHPAHSSFMKWGSEMEEEDASMMHIGDDDTTLGLT